MQHQTIQIATLLSPGAPSWWSLALLVTINIAALRLALTTKPLPRNASPVAQMLTRTARNTGFIVGIGGWVPAILLLRDLLRGSE
jgi:hypothetical protein